jgi:hypothetical protein
MVAEPFGSVGGDAMRKLPLFVFAALAASIAYGATMLMKPPPAEASVQSGSLSVIDLAISANLPMAEPADAF